MSLIQLLARQNLIYRKNNLQLQLLNGFSAKRNALSCLSFGNNFEGISAYERGLDLNSIGASVELTAINAELNALNNYSDNSRLNYFA